MVFCGWTFLVYYVLIVVLKSDDLNGVVFRMVNGQSFRDIFSALTEVSHRHSNYFYRMLRRDDYDDQRYVVALRYVDVWSMFYHKQSPNAWKICCDFSTLCSGCYTKNDEAESTTRNVRSMRELKQFDFQMWTTIAILLLPFALLVWANAQINEARAVTAEYDGSIAHWNWSDAALGHRTYPFCEMREVNGYLNAFDLVWLSQSGWYFKDPEILANSFRAWFGSNDTETGWRYNDTKVNFVENEYAPTVFHVRNERFLLDVVVIRGSYSFQDWVQDANLGPRR